ncbi:MAG: cation:proton antiporter [Holosporaceae bacterium]|nr:MAG: cation:proton antiporter [Holosporaceae bacterium]
METIPAQFWEVIYFLATAIIVSIVCRKLNVTSVLGYLLAGVALGPHALNLFTNIELSKHIAEFGVVFLLFTIGLELPWERLQELKKYVFGMGFLQVLLTSILFSSVALYFGANTETSILLGIGLSFLQQLLSCRFYPIKKRLRLALGAFLFQHCFSKI